MNVREIRTDLGLTQAQFAKQLGVSPRSVMRWENGKDPTPAAQARILKRFDGNSVTRQKRGRKVTPVTSKRSPRNKVTHVTSDDSLGIGPQDALTIHPSVNDPAPAPPTFKKQREFMSRKPGPAVHAGGMGNSASHALVGAIARAARIAGAKSVPPATTDADREHYGPMDGEA